MVTIAGDTKQGFPNGGFCSRLGLEKHRASTSPWPSHAGDSRSSHFAVLLSWEVGPKLKHYVQLSRHHQVLTQRKLASFILSVFWEFCKFSSWTVSLINPYGKLRNGSIKICINVSYQIGEGSIVLNHYPFSRELLSFSRAQNK